MHPAEAVGDDRDARAVAVAAGQLQLLTTEEGPRGRVRDRRQAGIEEVARHPDRIDRAVGLERADGGGDDVGELALVDPACPPE